MSDSIRREAGRNEILRIKEEDLKRNVVSEAQSPEKQDAIDPVFKEVIHFRFGLLNIPVQTQVEVSRLPRTMDALIILKQNQEREKVQLQTPFGHFGVYNQLEFKGIRDALTIWGYHLIVGRAHLYIGDNKIPASQMTVTIVCASKPRRVLTGYDHVRFNALGDGHYISLGELPVHIIVINELPMAAKNYPLLLFTSSRRKFRQFLKQMLEERNLDYIHFAYRVHPQLTKEVLAMAGRHRMPKKDLEFIANDIGTELLPFIRTEDLLKHLSLEERLRGLNAEERSKLRQLLDEMDEK